LTGFAIGADACIGQFFLGLRGIHQTAERWRRNRVGRGAMSEGMSYCGGTRCLSRRRTRSCAGWKPTSPSATAASGDMAEVRTLPYPHRVIVESQSFRTSGPGNSVSGLWEPEIIRKARDGLPAQGRTAA
jgi:hypothetical protein